MVDNLALRSQDEFNEGLDRELTKQIRQPTANDLGIACCALALRVAAKESPVIADIAYEAYAHRPTINPQESFNHTLRSLQAQALPLRDEIDYPAKFIPFRGKSLTEKSIKSATSNWSNLIDRILNDPHQKERFDYDMVWRRNQANKEMRGKAIKLVGVGLAARFGYEPTILDIGTSQLRVPKHLALELPFNRTKVINPFHNADEPIEKYRDIELSRRVSSMLRARWKPSQIDGVDIEFPDDPRNKEWVEGCSFYPSELLVKPGQKKSALEKYRELSDASPKNVRYADADFSRPNPDPVVTTLDDETRQLRHERLEKYSYDIISALTMTYQLSESEQKQWFLNCLDYLKPGGVIVLSDFAVPDYNPKQGINYLDDWSRPWSYRTFLYDSLAPNKGFEEVFRWFSGRCSSLQAGLGAAAILG